MWILWELMFPGCYYWNAAAAFLTVSGLEALYFPVPPSVAFTWELKTKVLQSPLLKDPAELLSPVLKCFIGLR